MYEVHCIPCDDPQFANCVRAVAAYLRPIPLLARRKGAWEGPLRRAFGYLGVEARILAIGPAPSVTVYRDGAPWRFAHRRRVCPAKRAA